MTTEEEIDYKNAKAFAEKKNKADDDEEPEEDSAADIFDQESKK